LTSTRPIKFTKKVNRKYFDNNTVANIFEKFDT